VAAVLAPEIEAGLQLIRVRQRRMGHILMGLIPFVLVAAAQSALPPGSEAAFIAAGALYGVLLLAYSLRLAFTECPRCQGFYHWKLWSDPFTKRCLHCGLSLENGDGG
jgi:hypothetical protein